MSETISKASVCEILADIYPTDGEKVVAVKEIDKAYEAIQQLPSAQPQRVRGRWKRTYLDHEAMGERPSVFYCSGCSQCIAYPTNYCPSCGSYNGGSQDG